jgi:hypothetical protein
VLNYVQSLGSKLRKCFSYSDQLGLPDESFCDQTSSIVGFLTSLAIAGVLHNPRSQPTFKRIDC